MEQPDNTPAKNLALALIYLSALKEKDADEYRAWKGYNFGILDTLKEDGYIDFSSTAKSLYLTREGLKKAQALIKKFSE
jgi:hypothetical protein